MPAPLVLSKEAVAGHTKRAAALNAQRVSTLTMSILNLWRNQWRASCTKPCPYMRLSTPSSLPEKTCFLPIRTRLPACFRARWLSEVLLNRAFSAVRCCFCRGVSLTLARTSLEVARCASRGSAVFAHATPSRPNVFIFSWRRSPIQASKLLLASIKRPWKFKAFHKV